MGAAVAVATTVEEQLSWERRMAPKAAIAAVLAGVLTLIGGVYNGLALNNKPAALFVDALGRLEQNGKIGGSQSAFIPQFEFFQNHSGALILGGFLLGLGALATGLALTYLAFATRARNPRFPRVGVYFAFVGGVLVCVASIVSAFGTNALVDALLAGPKTVDAIRDTARPVSFTAGRLIQAVGVLALAGAYVLVCLQAMRVGLLTRFMGVLGVIVGLLIVIPLLAAAPILQPFWLIALGALFAGRWPGGVPPAWRTGRAEPWPTAAEQRERRRAAQASGGGAAVAIETAPERPSKPHPSSKKRKRKRRG
jgi:hypothetical protein